MLGSLAHAVGYPLPVGGSQAIIDELVRDLKNHGGQLVTGHKVNSLAELTDARTVLLDTSPQELVRLAGRNKGECRFVPGALREWAYRPLGVECVFTGTLKTPEGSVPLAIPLKGFEGGPGAETAGRVARATLRDVYQRVGFVAPTGAVPS